MREPTENRLRTVLNPRHERFCREYVKSGIAAHAYVKAGYKSTGDCIYFNSSRLKSMDKVKERIAELQEMAFQASDLSKDNLVAWIADLALRCKLAKNLGAEGQQLERIAKMTGAWVDKHEDVTKTSDTGLLEQLQALLEPIIGKSMASDIVKDRANKLKAIKETSEGKTVQ